MERVVDPEVTDDERPPPAANPDDETRAHRLPPPPVGGTQRWPTASRPTGRVAVPPPPLGHGRPRGAEPSRRAGPSRPRRALAIALMALVVVAAIGAAVVVGLNSDEPTRNDFDGVATDTWHPKYPPQKDVSLEDCKIERTGAQVGGTVRNPTDEPADYVIEVELVDPDGATITSGQPTAAAIPANSKASWMGTIPAVASTAQSATCKVVKVNRYPAE